MTPTLLQTRRITLLKKAFMVALLALPGLAMAAPDGISKSTITLGQSVALTGPSSALGVPFAQGAKLYFDRLNGAGGVNGRQIELATLDDMGSPAQAVLNTKKLLGQGVLSLFG